MNYIKQDELQQRLAAIVSLCNNPHWTAERKNQIADHALAVANVLHEELNSASKLFEELRDKKEPLLPRETDFISAYRTMLLTKARYGAQSPEYIAARQEFCNVYDAYRMDLI